ncbi:MAG: biopolymer transporter ExbD [Cytophagales bacterium]
MKTKSNIKTFEEVKEVLSFYEKKREKGKLKEAPRIDMNPVCDLAFQLIIFFMLATTFTRPQTMEIAMPVKNKANEEPLEIKESKALNLVLHENNQLFWFLGNDVEHSKATDYSTEGLRKLLLAKNKEIEDMMVLIKPGKLSTYRNLVDVLDEMNITETKRYAIVELSENELKAILLNFL